MSFKDLVVVVTGAANGIGKDVSRAYAKQGAKVVLADVDETEGERHAEAIQRQGGEAIFVKQTSEKKATFYISLKNGQYVWNDTYFD